MTRQPLKRLTPSLITSYRPTGVLRPGEASDRLLAPFHQDHYGRTVAAEAYLFMESELASWGAADSDGGSALEFLAGLTPQRCGEIAATIVDWFRTVSPTGGPLALASFLPEVARDPATEAAGLVRRAIASMLRIASELQRLTKQPVTIELVAGSLVDDVSEIDGKLHAKLLSDKDGCKRVLDALGDAWAISAVAPDSESPRCVLELEPGPLFLLRDRTTLRRFAKHLQRRARKDPAYARIGFNLDVAHWWLQGIEPAWLDKPSSAGVRDRIFHAHIAGHSDRGHFGDMSLVHLSESGRKKFRDWLRWLANSAPPEFAGRVSVECEAAYGDEVVVSSVRELCRWIDELCGFPPHVPA